MSVLDAQNLKILAAFIDLLKSSNFFLTFMNLFLKNHYSVLKALLFLSQIVDLIPKSSSSIVSFGKLISPVFTTVLVLLLRNMAINDCMIVTSNSFMNWAARSSDIIKVSLIYSVTQFELLLMSPNSRHQVDITAPFMNISSQTFNDFIL